MINYFRTTIIWLSLEDFYNRGLSSEEAKIVIENISEPFQKDGFSSSLKLQCEKQYINGNWNVKTFSTDQWEIKKIVEMIEFRLNEYLKNKSLSEGD